VAFEDLSDPKTVSIIPPDSMENAFGAGIKIKEITVEITNEKITSRILEILKWLPEFYSKRLDGKRLISALAEHRDANSLSSGNFMVRGK